MDIANIRLALQKSKIAAYEWDYATGNISWEGNLKDVFGVEIPDSISNRRGFLSVLDAESVDSFTAQHHKAVAMGGDYSFRYNVVLPDKRVVMVSDSGAVNKTKAGAKLLGVITVDGLKPDEKSSINLERLSSDFKQDFQNIYNNSITKNQHNVLLEISLDNLPMVLSFASKDDVAKLLEMLEKSITATIREGDMICRSQADRFHVVLVDHSQLQAEAVVNRILKVIQLCGEEGFKEVPHFRCSIGSISFPRNTESAEDTLKKVALALNVARGRTDRFYCDYAEAHKEFQEERQGLTRVHHMNRAFDRSKMHLAYQPIVDSKNGSVFSYECLLRLEDDNGNFHSVGELVAAAERLGTIEIIDDFVLQKAAEELKLYPNLVLNFNVSNLTTDNQRWLKKVGRLMPDESVAKRVIVEITETAAQRDMRQTAYFVASLQALGCRVALDDFGAGYTSFRQIKSLSVDMIKIDGAYITDLTTNSENMVFVKTLLDFSKNYGLRTVAECIETGDVAKVLIDQGADYLQGYYFGRPELQPEFKREFKLSANASVVG